MPVEFSTSSKIVILAVGEAIGSCVLYLHYLNWLASLKGVKKVDTQFLADAFPNGFYSQIQLQEFWNAQKDERGRNLIDAEMNEIINQATSEVA